MYYVILFGMMYFRNKVLAMDVIFYRKVNNCFFFSYWNFEFIVVVDSIWVRRQYGVYMEPAIQGGCTEARGT